MLRFVIARLGVLIPTFLGVTIVAFGLIRLIPGDPIQIFAGERGIDAERHAKLMAEYGLDTPLWEQYLAYLGGVLQGDLGQSIVTKQPVLNEFMALFPATIELSVCALLLAVAIGLPAGVVAGVKRGSVFDHGLMGISLTGFSMPIFWWGLLLIILFSGILQWTPVSGRIWLCYFFRPSTGFFLFASLLPDRTAGFAWAPGHLFLPTIVLGPVRLGSTPGRLAWAL